MFKLLTLVSLSLLGTQSLVFANPGPSAVPTTGYSCPAADSAGFALGDTNLASDPIFCSYPAISGENPNDFFCTYSAVCYSYSLVLAHLLTRALHIRPMVT